MFCLNRGDNYIRVGFILLDAVFVTDRWRDEGEIK